MRTSVPVALPADAVDHYARLVNALAALTDEGERTPCQTYPDAFTGPDGAASRVAADLCALCPVLDLCADYADAAGERWHVWGGRSRGPTARRGRQAAADRLRPDLAAG